MNLNKLNFIIKNTLLCSPWVRKTTLIKTIELQSNSVNARRRQQAREDGFERTEKNRARHLHETAKKRHTETQPHLKRHPQQQKNHFREHLLRRAHLPDANSKPRHPATCNDTHKRPISVRDVVSAIQNTEGKYNRAEPWNLCLNGWKKMAKASLAGTEAEKCEITRLLQSAFRDTVSALEQEENNRTRPPSSNKDNHPKPQPISNMADHTSTPTAQLKLAADSYEVDEQLDPTRNLEEDLEMATPAQKNKIHQPPPRGLEERENDGTEDTEMGTASKYLRGSPEPPTGQASKEEIRALAAQVEDLKVADKEHRRSIASIKQRQDKLHNTVQKVEDLEVVVQENSDAIMQHADTIRESTSISDKLIQKLEGVVRDVQSQGQKALDQFKTLKDLIANQRKLMAPPIHQQETYAQKAASAARMQEEGNPK